MHPPWIITNFILLLCVTTCTASKEAEENDAVNSTVQRPQREIYERERRLIPYMTYYVTQSLTNPNGGVRQNVLIPLTSPRENVYQLGTVPKLSLTNIQNDNSQPIEALSKPLVRLSSPAFLTPSIQLGHYRPKEGGFFPQIYSVHSGIIRPQIQAQVQPQQIQSETQPLQVVKVNPVATEQKYAAPRIIKIIPVITKLSPEDRSAKSFNPQQPQLAYREGTHTPAHQPSTANYQSYYKEPVSLHNEYSFDENKLYASQVSQENARPGSIGTDTNKYTVANIFITSTTPSPYDDGVRKIESAPHQISIVQLSQSNPKAVGTGRGPIVSTLSGFANDKYETPVFRQQPSAYGENGEQSAEPQDAIGGHQAKGQLPKLRVPEEEKIRFVASVTPIPVTNDLESLRLKIQNGGQTEQIYETTPPNNILSLLKETNKLPQTLTPDNIDTGIKTLALILERLQQQRNLYQANKISSTGSTTEKTPTETVKQHQEKRKKIHSFPEKSGTSTPGRPGIDYPTYSSIPQTNFDCSTQRYKGFFGDPDTKCQVWHYCDLNGGQASFLCPNGTIFSQVALTCDWWFNVKCASTSQLYVLNERLYKYILPFSPSFPEDYSGPVVDTYLEAKFKEMEAKSKIKVLKGQTNATTTEKPEMTTSATTNAPTASAEEYRIQNVDA